MAVTVVGEDWRAVADNRELLEVVCGGEGGCRKSFTSTIYAVLRQQNVDCGCCGKTMAVSDAARELARSSAPKMLCPEVW